MSQIIQDGSFESLFSKSIQSTSSTTGTAIVNGSLTATNLIATVAVNGASVHASGAVTSATVSASTSVSAPTVSATTVTASGNISAVDVTASDTVTAAHVNSSTGAFSTSVSAPTVTSNSLVVNNLQPNHGFQFSTYVYNVVNLAGGATAVFNHSWAIGFQATPSCAVCSSQIVTNNGNCNFLFPVVTTMSPGDIGFEITNLGANTANGTISINFVAFV